MQRQRGNQRRSARRKIAQKQNQIAPKGAGVRHGYAAAVLGGVPAALIGRLARDEKARGRGIGELLLADAVRRILGASKTLAVFAIVVDAKDERAVKFLDGSGL
jgi:ribosomal protein S18 acetylase RimI-like enzyme